MLLWLMVRMATKGWSVPGTVRSPAPAPHSTAGAAGVVQVQPGRQSGRASRQPGSSSNTNTI